MVIKLMALTLNAFPLGFVRGSSSFASWLEGGAATRKDHIQRSPALACLELDQLSPCGAEPEIRATFGLLRGLVFLHSAHMPWLANTLWQLLLSLDLFCCRHCWTALSLPSCCRQKRDASRLQACCSCGVPIW